MNIEVDVYKALEALLLQECSGDAIVDDDYDEKTFASKNVSVSRVRLAMKLSEEKTTLRNTCSSSLNMDEASNQKCIWIGSGSW